MTQPKGTHDDAAVQSPVRVRGRGVSGYMAAIVLIGAFTLVVGTALQGQSDGRRAELAQAADASPDQTSLAIPAPASPAPDPAPRPRSRGDVAALPTGGTPFPDIARALPGDAGTKRLPLGTITDPPNPDRLDFLFELCERECFRDAHWMDPENPAMGSGVWTAGRPFHVREGFINEGEEPLGDDFDVVLYVTRLDGGGDAATYRYTSDHVVRGTSARCGPTYETQIGPAPCEWFVHEFAEGLPEGRFAIWAVWEAPCSAWLDMALVDSCQDPDEVGSHFASGFDAPYTGSAPEFTEIQRPVAAESGT